MKVSPDEEEELSPAVVESGIRISLMSNEGESGYRVGIEALRRYVRDKRGDGNSFAFTVESFDGVVECVMRKSDLYVKAKGDKIERVTYAQSNSVFGKLVYATPKDRLDALGLVIAEAVRFQPIAEYVAKQIESSKTTFKHGEQLMTPRGGLLSYRQIGCKETKPLTAGDCPHLWEASTKGIQFFETHTERHGEITEEININKIVKVGYKSQKKLSLIKKIRGMMKRCEAKAVAHPAIPHGAPNSLKTCRE